MMKRFLTVCVLATLGGCATQSPDFIQGSYTSQKMSAAELEGFAKHLNVSAPGATWIAMETAFYGHVSCTVYTTVAMGQSDVYQACGAKEIKNGVMGDGIVYSVLSDKGEAL